MLPFLARHWFLIALAVVLLGGMALAEPLAPVAEAKAVRNGVVFCILFVMSLPLSFATIWESIRRPWVALLATALNFGLLPLAACGMAAVMSATGVSRETVVGFLVAAATPCTLASAAVWTRRAGGNDAAAVIVTLLTNATCFLVTPLWLTATVGKSPTGEGAGELQFLPMVTTLGLLVVLPMCLAQLARLYRPLGRWATKHKTPLGAAAMCGVLFMILLGSIGTGLKMRDQTIRSSIFTSASESIAEWLGAGTQFVPLGAVLLEIALAAVAVVALHLAILFAGLLLARLAGFTREDRIAVAFAGSQKTLMVGLKVSLDLGASAIPMVVYHVGQLLVDTVIADRMRGRGEDDSEHTKQ